MRVVFFGTADFAVPALRAIATSEHHLVGVVSQMDRPSGRGLHLHPSPVSSVAGELGFETLKPASCKDPEFHVRVEELRPDVLVVAAYGQIMPVALLEIPPHGGLNIHASLLPKWRGAAPIQRAIQHGETETGITIMQMDAGMDTGDILLQESIPIGPDETAGELTERLAHLGARLILTALERLPAGLTRTPQDSALATKASKLSKEETVVDWSMPAKRVHDSIRAFDPMPAAQTTHRARIIKVFGSKLIDVAGKSGIVVSVSAEGMVVACGQGGVRIAEVQPEGRRRMSVLEYANGYGLRPGDLLGCV